MKFHALATLACASVFAAMPGALASNSVHVAYHWHLHQPIYWPEVNAGSAQSNRYQFAADSLDRKLANTGNFYPGSPYKHPRNALVSGDGGEYDSIFDKPDRVNAYQFGGRDSINTILTHPDGGASVSYSGSLMENVWSLGKDSRYGYGPNWNAGYTQARGSTPTYRTSSGFPRADMVGMTYHHSLGPLLPRCVLRKEIQIFKEIWWKTWNGNPDQSDHSKGFWPVECAFSETMIPVLVEEGYQWSIVANSHLARTCSNYLAVAQRGSSGWNIDPPNRADQLGPSIPPNQWWSGSVDGRGGAFPAPYAYQAHRAKYVDPDTGAESFITIVPMGDLLSYKNGFGTMDTGDIDAHIAPFNDPARPSIVLMAHDGDNAWGGGNSYYQESVPDLFDAAAAKGYRPTTIQQYLADHPVPPGDVVHIEDGAWVNAANDWGHPQFINWLWPPTRPSSDPAYNSLDPRTWYDLENGWTEDWRNWAVLVAGANFCETAEQITVSTGGSVQVYKIQEPVRKDGTSNNPIPAEQAWHYYLAGLDSGFMYFGTALDDEVKQTLAVNRAIGFATNVIGDGALDQTPPTIFKPQRFPWNPGGMGWGPLTGYKEVGFDGQPAWPSDFYIWTHVFDVSGTTNVTLFVRADNDGVNSTANNDNETYAGGPDVGAWVPLSMTRRVIPAGNVTGNGDISFFILPIAMADYYWVKVTGYTNVLLDYYVAATDARGNGTRSDIQHVWVGSGSTETGGATNGCNGRVCVSPTPLIAGAAATISYDAADGPLAGAGTVYVHLGWNNWNTLISPDPAMSFNPSSNFWQFTTNIPANATQLDVVFNNGSGTWDNNGGADWHFTVANDGTVTNYPPFVLDGNVDSSGYRLSAGGMGLYAAMRGTKLYVATASPGNSGPNDHFILVTDALLASATSPAPWAKAGLVAVSGNKPFLATESQNAYVAWYNAPAGSLAAKSSGTNGVLEGVIDLAAVFGVVPENIYLCAAAYATADGGALVDQSPAGSGPNLDPDEFLVIPTLALRDDNADGVFDRLNPQAFAPRIALSGGDAVVSWPAMPGRSYQLIGAPATTGAWTDVPGSLTNAGPLQLDLSFREPLTPDATQKYYRVKLLP